ncbi:hypothetical protein BDB00DRAFT_933201 [Zychaea mexicana]|uniref:uncharacterized protein n=1 Tax=Zychaea mexicana TaxID=64656 RepID=UPI0022FEAEE7|nr:uncharacterized protein BDB00DRAFT_933201 [Zychaea mexicana]KAI9485046.1 hypothetical protein BDB00DRAFT_933201 [Zychaea mexicana]
MLEYGHTTHFGHLTPERAALSSGGSRSVPIRNALLFAPSKLSSHFAIILWLARRDPLKFSSSTAPGHKYLFRSKQSATGSAILYDFQLTSARHLPFALFLRSTQRSLSTNKTDTDKCHKCNRRDASNVGIDGLSGLAGDLSTVNSHSRLEKKT